MRERVVERHQHRMHPLEQPVRAILRHADQTDAEAQRGGLGNVGGDDVADAGGGDRVEIQLRTERQARKYGQLVRRIYAINVEAGISLGIAQFLCFLENLVEAPTFLLHRRQDVIAGAVEDAVNTADLVGGSPFAHPLDDRDAARDRRFIFQGDAALFGKPGEVQSMMGQHRLVRGDERLARSQALARQGEGRAVRSADQFHHHIDIVAGGEAVHIVHPFIG